MHYRHHHRDCQSIIDLSIFSSQSHHCFHCYNCQEHHLYQRHLCHHYQHRATNDVHDSNLCRLFLWIFSIAVVVGTAGIILQVKYCDLIFQSEKLGKKHHFFAQKPKFCEINYSMQAPSLYDLRPAIDELLSEIQQEKAPIRV